MPRIDRIITLDISPERFLESCSHNELMEIDLLIGRYLVRSQKREDQNKEAEQWNNLLQLQLGNKSIEGIKPMNYRTEDDRQIKKGIPLEEFRRKIEHDQERIDSENEE